MAVGIYGNKTLATIDFNDVDILYAYSPSREEIGDMQLRPLFGSITENEFRKLFGGDGVYKLRLPASIFNRLGFYTIVIKPKSFRTTVIDCSSIVTNTDTEIQISKKGIIIPKLQFQGNGNLVGYQVEYFDENGIKIKNFHRIITSSDLVSVATNNQNSVSTSTVYNLNSNGSYLFLTLTPDEASLITNSQASNLGFAGQNIVISNTFFDPTVIEVEMVGETIETLGYYHGNSVKNNETGEYSIFDNNGNLYKQYNLITRKPFIDRGEIDIKEEKSNLNINQSFDDISQGL